MQKYLAQGLAHSRTSINRAITTSIMNPIVCWFNHQYTLSKVFFKSFSSKFFSLGTL